VHVSGMYRRFRTGERWLGVVSAISVLGSDVDK